MDNWYIKITKKNQLIIGLWLKSINIKYVNPHMDYYYWFTGKRVWCHISLELLKMRNDKPFTRLTLTGFKKYILNAK